MYISCNPVRAHRTSQALDPTCSKSPRRSARTRTFTIRNEPLSCRGMAALSTSSSHQPRTNPFVPVISLPIPNLCKNFCCRSRTISESHQKRFQVWWLNGVAKAYTSHLMRYARRIGQGMVWRCMKGNTMEFVEPREGCRGSERFGKP
jgi:hypothetical protein